MRRETGGRADRAVNVHDTPADPADQMMVVVADAILEASRRSRRLDAPYEALAGKNAQGVVDRLQRDRADLGPYGISHGIGGDVRLTRDCPQDSQALRRDLDAALSKEISRVDSHGWTIYQIMDSLQYLILAAAF